MTAKLVAVFLCVLLTQGFALPGTDVTTQDGGLIKQLTGGIFDSAARSANIFFEMLSGTSNHDISKQDISNCLPKLMLVYDAVTDTFDLHGEYKNVRDGFELKRDKCNKIWDTNKRLKCLRDLEQEEKAAYQKITDKARGIAKTFVTDVKGVFICIVGLA